MNEQAESAPILISEKEVARLMGLSAATLANYRKTDTGPPYIRLSNGPRSRIRYHADSVVEWIEGNTRQTCRVCGHSE
jgi:predicted DNA-binding transcriptional regulator AlpA